MIHAIIDIGSNTVRMAIYEIEGERIEFLMKKKHLVGLAAYLEQNRMTSQGIDKVCGVLEEFKAFLDIFKIKNVVAFTTAALRNCENSREAVAEIIGRTGVEIEIISGDKEAEYDYIGATRNIADDSGVLVDIGGASTELVYFKAGKIVHKVSLHMGSLSFKTKYVKGTLPTAEEIAQMRAEAQRIFAEAAAFKEVQSHTVVGIGGTFKGTCALYNGMYKQNKHNLQIGEDCIPAMIEHFSQLQEIPHEDAVLMMKQVPDRIHTIVPGMVIADVLIKHFGAADIFYSDSGVREGFIYSHLI